MKHSVFMLWLMPALLLANTIAAQSEYPTNYLKEGRFKEDSSYVYTLPFEHRKKVFLVQGYESMFSHKGERALDFKVKKGTTVCAARGGIVINLEKDSDKGGLKPGNLADGNYISIRHADGTVANYWHLEKEGALVQVGDTVTTGQPIGRSGNTGYSAFPHLHFEVWGYNTTGNYVQLPTRFRTRQGIIYLRPGHFYRAIHSL